MSDFKKILVIGGTGFIGEYLVRNLIQRSDLELSLIYNGDLKEEKISNINYYNVDLLNDFSENTIKLINESDCIVSLATPIPNFIKRLTLSISSSGPKKIVYTSTMLVYPDSDFNHSEVDPVNPETEYEKNKVEEEKILTIFSKNSDTKVCIARLGNVYGDIKNHGLVNYIMLALKNNETFTVNGDGNHRRDYVFVQDIANLLEFLIFNNQESNLEIYNICTGQNHTINDVINITEKVVGKKINKRYGNSIQEKINVFGENKKIINESNYKFEYNLVDGLKRTYNNYLTKE